MLNITKRLAGLILIIVLVVVNAVIISILLDKFGIKGHRLYTGIFGVMLITSSFTYSLRKKRLIGGSPRFWLFCHEWLAIAGTFVLLVHTGTNFKALIPTITLALTFTTFLSGLLGRYIYNNARAGLKAKHVSLKQEGLTDKEIEIRLWAHTIASATLSKWRNFHMPLVFLLIIVTIYHITSALYFRGF